jgi:hypothetical protein
LKQVWSHFQAQLSADQEGDTSKIYVILVWSSTTNNVFIKVQIYKAPPKYLCQLQQQPLVRLDILELPCPDLTEQPTPLLAHQAEERVNTREGVASHQGNLSLC